MLQDMLLLFLLLLTEKYVRATVSLSSAKAEHSDPSASNQIVLRCILPITAIFQRRLRGSASGRHSSRCSHRSKLSQSF